MAKEQEPAAWAVWSRQSGCLAASVRREDAVDMQSEFEVYTDIVPLYLSSPLTDAEREAIMGVANFVCELPASDETKVTLRKTADTLRGLLERLK